MSQTFKAFIGSIGLLLLLQDLSCLAWQDFDTLAFVQQWPVCKNASDCPIKGTLHKKLRNLCNMMSPFILLYTPWHLLWALISKLAIIFNECILDIFLENGEARFLIRALLPFEGKTGKIISDCDPNIQFDSQAIIPLEDSLEHSWPNWPIDPEDNETTVWEKEWKLHGSCIAPSIEALANELDYFTQGAITVFSNNFLYHKLNFPFH